MINKIVPLLLVVLMSVSLMSGCAVKYPDPIAYSLQEDGFVGMLYDLERDVPPPSFIRSYLETTTIGTGEDKDIFDFEDCDWDVQKYSSLGSYNTRSNKGWFITMNVNDVINPSYVSEIQSYAYVGHGNHKLYDDAHGVQGYYTPSSLRIQAFGGSAQGYSSYDYMKWDSSMTFRVNSPLFVMKENYITPYMYFEKWLPVTGTGFGWLSLYPPKIIVNVQLIDATSGGVIDSEIYEFSMEAYTVCDSRGCTGGYVRVKTDTLSNMAGMWRPVILNGSNYKGRTVFLRFDVDAYSGARIYPNAGHMGTGYSYDVYFDEIHFSDEYGDYITYYTSVPPVPNYTYTIADRTVAVNGTTSTDNGVITEYRWSWGDGTQSFGAIDTHQYSADNNYTVQLCVTDDEQMTVCIQKILNVKTTPTTNTVVTGATTPDNSTTTIVTPPVTTPVTTTPTSTPTTTGTTTTTTSTTNTFPWWGLFVFTCILALFIGAILFVLYLLRGKGGKKLKGSFLNKKGNGGKR